MVDLPRRPSSIISPRGPQVCVGSCTKPYWDPSFLDGLDHGLSSLQLNAKHFLKNDACLGGRYCDVMMHIVGGCDVDYVDIVTRSAFSNQSLLVGPVLGEGFGSILVAGANGCNWGSYFIEEVRYFAEGVGVSAAHEAISD